MTSPPTTQSPGLTIAAVIALYNGGAYIAEAIESILAQGRPADEIIVVDDGSTDNGAEIVQRMAATHPVTLLRKENGGQASARNLGVAHSKCVLIALLDQDDAWYPDHLAELVKPFEEADLTLPLGWVYSNLDEIDERGSLVAMSFLSTVNVGTEHPKRNLDNMLSRDMMIFPCSTLISRSAFDLVGGFDERLCGYEDDDLFLRIFSEGFDNAYIDRALGQYRRHSNSTSGTPRFLASGSVYYRKLFETYGAGDDEMHQRARRSLVDRFYPHALGRLYVALLDGDSGGMDRVLSDLDLMLPDLPRNSGRKVRLLKQLYRRPRTARAIFRAFHAMQRVIGRGPRI